MFHCEYCDKTIDKSRSYRKNNQMFCRKSCWSTWHTWAIRHTYVCSQCSRGHYYVDGCTVYEGQPFCDECASLKQSPTHCGQIGERFHHCSTDCWDSCRNGEVERERRCPNVSCTECGRVGPSKHSQTVSNEKVTFCSTKCGEDWWNRRNQTWMVS